MDLRPLNVSVHHAPDADPGKVKTGPDGWLTSGPLAMAEMTRGKVPWPECPWEPTI